MIYHKLANQLLPCIIAFGISKYNLLYVNLVHLFWQAYSLRTYTAGDLYIEKLLKHLTLLQKNIMLKQKNIEKFDRSNKNMWAESYGLIDKELIFGMGCLQHNSLTIISCIHALTANTIIWKFCHWKQYFSYQFIKKPTQKQPKHENFQVIVMTANSVSKCKTSFTN